MQSPPFPRYLVPPGSKLSQIHSLTCAVVSLKPGHMDCFRDFDFKLNLFSRPSPWHYHLFLRRMPNRPLRSYPQNRPLLYSQERQILAAATIHKDSGTVHVVSWSTYVFKHEQELVNKVFMLYVFQFDLLTFWRRNYFFNFSTFCI